MNREPRRGTLWLIAPLAAAAACFAAALVDADAWVRLLSGGTAVEGIDPALYERGARTLRVGLMISGAALLAVPLLLRRVERSGPGPQAPPAAVPTLWLLGLLVLGLLARAPRLGESLWYDEIAAWRQFGANGPGFVVGNFFDPANHVAHTLATCLSVRLLEPSLGSELALRVPALLCSLGVIVAVLGPARLAGGPRVAVIAAGLAAVLPVGVLEGVEARGYSLMILAAALSTWMWCVFRRSDSAAGWTAYAAVVAVGAWAHPMTVFVPAGHALCLLGALLREGRRARPLAPALALLLGAMLTVTLYAPIIAQIVQLRSGLLAATADQPRLIGPEGWHALLQLGGAWAWWAALPGLILLGVGATAACRPPASRVVAPAAAGALLWAAAVVLAGTWVYARFMLFALPAAIIVMALGADRLLTRRRTVGLVLLGCLLVASIADLAVRPPKQPLRDAADWVALRAEADEPVAVIGLAHRVLDVYAGGLDLRYSLGHGADLARVLDTHRPRHVIGYYPRHIEAAATAALAERGYAVARRFDGWVDWDNGDVLVWERGGRSAAPP